MVYTHKTFYVKQIKVQNSPFSYDSVLQWSIAENTSIVLPVFSLFLHFTFKTNFHLIFLFTTK